MMAMALRPWADGGAKRLAGGAARGLVGAMIWQVPHQDLPFAADHYERFWAAAQDMELPINLHILTGFDYSARDRGGPLEAHRGSVNLKIAGASNVVSTASQTIADGKYYSFFMSGPYDATTSTADAFVVEDPIPGSADDSVGYVRLVNAVSNGTDALTLYVTNTDTTKLVSTIGSPVAYKTAGTFEKLARGSYTLAVRYPGSSSNVISRTSAVSVGSGHVYTVTAYGSTATSSTLGLDFTENQR